MEGVVGAQVVMLSFVDVFAAGRSIIFKFWWGICPPLGGQVLSVEVHAIQFLCPFRFVGPNSQDCSGGKKRQRVGGADWMW